MKIHLGILSYPKFLFAHDFIQSMGLVVTEKVWSVLQSFFRVPLLPVWIISKWSQTWRIRKQTQYCTHDSTIQTVQEEKQKAFWKYCAKKNRKYRWPVLPLFPHWTNGDAIFWLSRKYCGKRRNCSLWAISPFPTMFSKTFQCWCIKVSIYGVKD